MLVCADVLHYQHFAIAGVSDECGTLSLLQRRNIAIVCPGIGRHRRDALDLRHQETAVFSWTNLFCPPLAHSSARKHFSSIPATGRLCTTRQAGGWLSFIPFFLLFDKVCSLAPAYTPFLARTCFPPLFVLRTNKQLLCVAFPTNHRHPFLPTLQP